MLIAALSMPTVLHASPPLELNQGPNDVYERIVDVSAALCVVADIPGEYYMVYDTGLGRKCIVEVREIVDTTGSRHENPIKYAAERYQKHGVPLGNSFRTDRGVDEPGEDHWQEGSVTGCEDKSGDNGVDIVIREDGTVDVDYRLPQDDC